MINSSGSSALQQAALSAASGAGSSNSSVASARLALFDSIFIQLQAKPLAAVSVAFIAPPHQQLQQLQQDGCSHF